MENVITETNVSETPALVKTIGKTTYVVNVHFSDTTRETVVDKLQRLIVSDAKSQD